MIYDGPSPKMSYRYGDQLQPYAAKLLPVRYERAHDEEDDDLGVSWRADYDKEEK
jgi:hypothetical protein